MRVRSSSAASRWRSWSRTTRAGSGVRAGEDEITSPRGRPRRGRVNTVLAEQAVATPARSPPRWPSASSRSSSCRPPRSRTASWSPRARARRCSLWAMRRRARSAAASCTRTGTPSAWASWPASQAADGPRKAPVYQMLEDLKHHPAVAPLIRGGKVVEHSGHMVPEGGVSTWCPRTWATGDGVPPAGGARRGRHERGGAASLPTGHGLPVPQVAAVMDLFTDYGLRSRHAMRGEPQRPCEACPSMRATLAGEVRGGPRVSNKRRSTDSFVMEGPRGRPRRSRRWPAAVMEGFDYAGSAAPIAEMIRDK